MNLVQRRRVAGVVLLRELDGAALLQHRDNKPGLPHANQWVPPGGHCEDDEALSACAEREFLEETGYRCANLRFLLELDVDHVPDSPPLRLTMFWDVYDGQQSVVCREGQVLEFVTRAQVSEIAMPPYLVEVWDLAVAEWRSIRNAPLHKRRGLR